MLTTCLRETLRFLSEKKNQKGTGGGGGGDTAQLFKSRLAPMKVPGLIYNSASLKPAPVRWVQVEQRLKVILDYTVSSKLSSAAGSHLREGAGLLKQCGPQVLRLT